MNCAPLPRPLRGIIPPMITPLIHPDAIDRFAVVSMLERLITAGVSGIFILGTTGEAQNLSYKLRREFVQLVCTSVAGRVPVLVGISDTAVEESVRFAEFAQALGASAVVLAAPYYFVLDQEELLRHVACVAREISLPLYLYNIPELTKVAFAPETVRAASRISNVFGIKDSSGDLNYLSEVISAMRDRPEFTILCGPEELLAQALRLGAHGGIAGGSNLWPELYIRLYNAVCGGDEAAVDRLQHVVLDISTFIYHCRPEHSSYLRGLKCALSAMGYCHNVLAEPFQPFGRDDARAVASALLKCGLHPAEKA